MNVVSDTGAVFGGVVVAEYAELWSFAYNDLLYVGKEVVGMNKWFISNQIRGMCAAGVEITQRYYPPVLMQLTQRI